MSGKIENLAKESGFGSSTRSRSKGYKLGCSNLSIYQFHKQFNSTR